MHTSYHFCGFIEIQSMILRFLYLPILVYSTGISSEGELTKIILLKENGQENIVEWFEKMEREPQSRIPFQFVIVDLASDKDDKDKVCKSFTHNGSLVIDVTWSGNDDAKEICENVRIPYLRIDLSISPALILLDKYLDYRNSSDVSLIFDDPKNVDQVLYFWIDSTRMRMVISENLDDTTAKRLRGMRPTPNNFAIVASTKNMNVLFKKALEENLVTLPERWNLVFLDFKHKNFDRTLINGRPVNLLSIDEQLCCDILDLDPCVCPNNFNLQEKFLEIFMKRIFNILDQLTKEGYDLAGNVDCESAKFSVRTKMRFNELFFNMLEHNSLFYDDRSTLRLKITGSVEVGTKSSTEIIAKYRDDNGIELMEGKKIKPIKAFYRIGITHALPWSYKDTDSTGKTYWTGYCVDFAVELAKLLNFDFEFVEPEVGTFGEKRNGKWDGVVGDLARGETDLAITALVMTADKEELIDFVAPYYEQTGISIVMRKPVRKTSLFKFMTVLKLEVWLSIVGALIVTGFMVWFLDKYSPYSARNNKKAYPYPCREFTLKESFWFALTSFTPQGGGEAPKALSGRTLVAAYWLFVVLMLATFTANLAAFLTVERMQTPVQSLEQLSRQSRINYTVVMESDTHKYFINMKHAEDTLYRMWKELTLNSSTDDTQYRVWDYPIREQYGHILLAINDSNPVANASEGFRLVNEHLDADFAFIHDSSEIKYEISRDCNLTEVGDVFAEKPYAVAVQQGSHLQDDISRAILNLQTERFFEHLQAKYWNHSSKGSCPSTDDNEGITLESLGGVFIATLFGLALAMVTLAVEVLYYRNKRKKQEQLKNEKEKMKKMDLVPKLIKPETITIGTEFNPVKIKNMEFFQQSQFPRSRNRISQITYNN